MDSSAWPWCFDVAVLTSVGHGKDGQVTKALHAMQQRRHAIRRQPWELSFEAETGEALTGVNSSVCA